MVLVQSKQILPFTVIVDSDIVCHFIKSASECESAAHALGLSDVTVTDDGQDGVTYDPPFCYFEDGSLKFNSMASNTGPCTTIDQCICLTRSAGRSNKWVMNPIETFGVV